MFIGLVCLFLCTIGRSTLRPLRPFSPNAKHERQSNIDVPNTMPRSLATATDQKSFGSVETSKPAEKLQNLIICSASSPWESGIPCKPFCDICHDDTTKLLERPFHLQAVLRWKSATVSHTVDIGIPSFSQELQSKVRIPIASAWVAPHCGQPCMQEVLERTRVVTTTSNQHDATEKACHVTDASVYLK